MSTPITDFRVIPLVVFRCPECQDWMKIEQNLPDILSTEATCQWCKAEYKVTWGTMEREIEVEMLQGQI